MTTPSPQTPSAIASSVIDLLNTRGKGDYIGESISQLEHSLQAAHLASKSSSKDSTIIAALLHDIGQFLPLSSSSSLKMLVSSSNGDSSVGRIGHERIGEEYLRDLGFKEEVCRLVGSHVAAKRYLTAVDEGYYAGLSEASKKSLMFQGGPFEGLELEQFRGDRLCGEMVLLRRCDDAAKVVGIEDQTPRPEAYRGMIERCLGGAA